MKLHPVLCFILGLFLITHTLSSRADFPHFVPQSRQETGVGTWQDMPFGKMRLVSCSSGVKDLPLVVGGLQINLDTGWSLKKPTLHSISSLPAQISYPIRPGSGRNTLYHDKVFFPITYARSPSDKEDFTFGIQGEFVACKQDDCLTLPIQTKLLLSADEANYTSLCAYIIDQQLSAPLDALYANLTGLAYTDKDGIHLQLSGIKTPHLAFLQTETNDPFQVTETLFNPRDIQITITNTTPWKTGETKNWIVITDKGIYRVPFKMQTTPFTAPPLTLEWHFWLIGFEWFLLSALLVWWGLGTPQNGPLLKKQIQKIILGVLLIYGLILTAYYFKWNQLISPNFMFYFGVCVLISICLSPRFTWGSTLIFFLTGPKPFLENIPLSDVSISTFWLWTGITLLEMILPFIVLYKNATPYGKILRQEMKKNKRRLRLTFLMPTLGMLAWCIYTHPFHNFYTQENLVPKDLVVVCPKTDSECGEWRKNRDIPVQIFSDTSATGKALRAKYNRPTGALIIWYDTQETFVLPPNSSVRKTKNFIRDVNKYRAFDTP